MTAGGDAYDGRKTGGLVGIGTTLCDKFHMDIAVLPAIGYETVTEPVKHFIAS
jgi:hypothetical protein